MTQTVHLIYNPHAGTGAQKEALRHVAARWRRSGWDIEMVPTQRAEHATELAQQAADAGIRLVIAAGGDGTLNEVANGLAYSETILAPLPMGTANSFAKDLNLPMPDLLPDLIMSRGLLEASDALMHGRVQRLDLGRTNKRYWLLWASAGADSYIVDQIEPRGKRFKQFGPAGYAVKGLSVLPTFPGMLATVTVRNDDAEEIIITDHFIMVNVINCRLYAGGELRLNPDAAMDDGLFEVWMMRGNDWAAALQHVWKLSWEMHVSDPDVKMVRGQHITVRTTPPLSYQVDGEPAGKAPFTCELCPGALKVLVPARVPRGLFVQQGEAL